MRRRKKKPPSNFSKTAQINDRVKKSIGMTDESLIRPPLMSGWGNLLDVSTDMCSM
jgi:hypothetical protein